MKREFLNHQVVRDAAILMFVLLSQAWGVSAAPGESVNQSMQEWIARQEIAVLQRRYAQATDLIAADRAANEQEVVAIYKEIFTEDAEMGVLDRLTLDGPMKWLELVKAKFVPLDNAQHLIGSQVVEIESLPDADGLGGSATMRSYVQATHVNSDGTLERVLGTYHSAAIYAPGSGWRLSKMVLELLSTEDAKIAAPLALEVPE